MEIELKDRIEQSFSTYAAMTIQHRAIFDVRDCLKPSQRMAMYSQFLDKITYKKPHQKSHLSVVSAMKHFYVHGDSPMEDLLCRMGSDINMRYAIEDTVGNMGTYAYLNDHAAARYTEMRLSEMGTKMVDGIEKESIDVWFDNFDNTEQFPSVLPSLGYYNIVNGTTGIAVGLSCSIPQFNLREVNEALIKLLWNPDIDFDEIYCPPDFATGGTILNAKEVKESLRLGRGKSAIIRGTIEYNEKNNLLQVTEVPYGVATNRIFHEIGGLFNPDPEKVKNGTAPPSSASLGIERFTDSSEEIVDLTVWLSKSANPTKVVKNLFKYTSIQSHFPINMTMLDNGTSPKVFGWKEALQAHLDHEIKVRRKMHEYDIKKIDERLPIVDAIVLALTNVDEVVQLIRNSKNTSEAKTKLIERFGYNEAQAKAVVDIKLGRLANMEVQSFKDEKEQLTNDRNYHVLALEDNNVLYKDIEKDLREVADKFGDERRTKLMDLDYKNSEEDAEPIEKKELLIYLTNLGNIYTQESTTLMKTKRGGKGSKIKMGIKEYVVKTIKDDNFSTICAFSNAGTMYSCPTSELPVNDKISTKVLFELDGNETINTIVSFDKHSENEYITFVTKNGFVKKTAFKEYRLRKGKSLKAINLDNDEVVSVFVGNDTRLAILTERGLTINIDINEVTATGRATKGVIGIKLNKDDSVIDAKMISKGCKYIVTLSKSGLIKKADIADFPLCSRATKGKKISDVIEDDDIVGFLTLNEDSDIIITTKKKVIKFSTSELRVLSRAAVGVKAITIDDGDNAITLAKED